MGGFDPKPVATTLRPTNAADIGNAHIEGKGVCPPGGAKTSACFLDDTVRTTLNQAISSRVDKAAVWWVSALAKVRLEEALKEPDDLPMVEDLLLDVLTGLLGQALKKTIKNLRGKPQSAIVDLGVGVLDIERGDKVKEADEGAVGGVVKAMTSAAKKGLKTAAMATEKDEFNQDKEVATDYLSQLADSAAGAFDRLSLEALGMLGDADKILYFHAWDPSAHTESVYVGEIKAKLAAYQASPASKIGRTMARKHLKKPTGDSSFSDTADYAAQGDVRATKLVMHYYDNEEQPRLYYYKRDFDGGPARMPGGDQFLDTENEYPENFAKDDGYVLYKEVEPMFVDAAIANNKKQWGHEYDQIHVNVPDQAKMVARREPPAQDTKPRVVPLTQLIHR
jgi:hypothetical protein